MREKEESNEKEGKERNPMREKVCRINKGGKRREGCRKGKRLIGKEEERRRDEAKEVKVGELELG